MFGNNINYMDRKVLLEFTLLHAYFCPSVLKI